MVDVRVGRCSYNCCSNIASFDLLRGEDEVYCKQHAEDGMIIVLGKRRSASTCTKPCTFDIAGAKTGITHARTTDIDGTKAGNGNGSTGLPSERCSHMVSTKGDIMSTPKQARRLLL